MLGKKIFEGGIMKKILSVLVCCLIVFSANFCSASNSIIVSEEKSIGGIPLPDKNDTARKIYGQPTRIQGSGAYRIYFYGDSVEIGHEEGVAVSILITKNNGWKTSKGLGVGMNIEDAIKIYGYPEITKAANNKVLYIYGKKLWITFDKNSKKISKILLYRSIMADFEEYFNGWSKRMLE